MLANRGCTGGRVLGMARPEQSAAGFHFKNQVR
jgi:hypothetical protein